MQMQDQLIDVLLQFHFNTLEYVDVRNKLGLT